MEKIKNNAKSFQDLIVWQKAHKLVLKIYSMTKKFPSDERFGLTNQMRRSAVSIPANIAEGFRRKTEVDKVRFYNISQSSLEETRYYLILTQDLEYAEPGEIFFLIGEVSKLLSAYVNSILSSEK